MGIFSLGSGDDANIARRLWSKYKNEWVTALYSPFVIGVAAGTLDPRCFIHCISQDVFFLQAFAQAYELAEEYADDEDKEAIHKLRKRVLKRIGNHDALVQDWGFEVPKENTSYSATVKYTEFLLETASGKVEGDKFPGKIATPFEKTKLAAYTLSVISPCMRVYSSITKEIQALLGPGDSNNIYKKWIDDLSSDKFEASASRIEDLLEKLSISLTGEELEIVERLYHQALKLELEFLLAQPMVQNTIVPYSRFCDSKEENLKVFCDFDLTCTTIDSAAILAELAIVVAAKSELSGSETQPAEISSADLRTTWNNLSSQFTEEHEQCIESIIANEAVGGLDYEGLSKALEQISDVEKSANSRVVDSNVLKGLSISDIKRTSEHLSFQDGCKKFFQDVVNSENCRKDVHVISYCWCGDLIRSAFSSGNLNALNVHSNELIYEESITTGEMTRKMESPMDKLQAFNEICEQSRKEGKSSSSVYIGGSVGDLLCLLHAEIGIVFCPSDSLMKLGDHFGICFVPLFSGIVSKQKELAESGSRKREGISSVLYTVSTWAEIHAFILG